MPYELKRRLYERSPGALRALVGAVPFRWWAGRPYRAVRARDAWIDRASREELAAWQEERLRRILAFAAAAVPAYASLRGAVGRLRPFEALRAFPLLGREDLLADPARYQPVGLGAIPHYSCTTGGTSGRQLRLLLDDGSQSAEMGFMHRHWARVGYRPRCRKATVRGTTLPPLPPGVHWHPNPIYNEMQFSPFHLSAETFPAYWAALRRYRPAFLHGYPSAIALLADLCRQAGADGRALGLRGALLGSEGLAPGQRERIESAFGVRVYSWYGHSERVILAGECERSESYHAFPDYGVLEIVRDGSGAPVFEGESGELVGTGFWNRAMPLIRYRTGDRARRLAPECACGRRHERFDSVEGRWEQDCVEGRHGTRISLAALNVHGPCFDRVLRYQYAQAAPGRMEIRVVPAPGFCEADERAILDAYARRCGGELEIAVARVADIPLTARGKLPLLAREGSGTS